MATRWRGMLTPINAPTGDGRRMALDSITHRDLPLALKWQRTDAMGHDDSVIIGSFDRVEIGDTEVWGYGTFFDDIDPQKMPRLAEDVAEAMKLAEEGVIGPSVDGGAATAMQVIAGTDRAPTEEDYASEDPADWPELEILFTEFEIAAATLVPIPAYAETTRPFEIIRDDDEEECPPGHHRMPDGECMPDDEMDEDAALVSAVTGSTDLPVADRERDWSGSAAASRVFEHYTDGDSVDTEGVARAFLYRDPDADPTTKGAYKLGFADVIDGQLQIIPRGVAATAGGRGVGAASIPDDDKSRIRSKICTLYDKVRGKFDDWPECPFDGDIEASSSASTSAALVASVSEPVPAEWFEDPKLSELTAFYRDGKGRVFGHLADLSACHVAFKPQCLTPPESQTDYALFERYPFATSAGLDKVGRITTGHGQIGTDCDHPKHRGLDDHACPKRFDFLGTVAHHDRMRTLARVKVGHDERNNAIWFAGVEEDGISDEDVAVMERRRVSGDWRNMGNSQELCEILALANAEPGFPVPPTTVHMDGQRAVALVAAGLVTPATPARRPTPGQDFDYERLADLVAQRLHPQPEEITVALNTESADRMAALAGLGNTIGTLNDGTRWLAMRRARQITQMGER